MDLGEFSEGRAKDQKIGGKWGPNGMAVMGQMGTSLQPADVIYHCSELREPCACFQSSLCMLKGLLRPGYYRNCTSKGQ